ncbi:MAG: hypothetical protein GY737_01000 [Desulfobacteraceae bacterium]|nr:hypothetical protein [Desulfobacteraceae bacterium]
MIYQVNSTLAGLAAEGTKNDVTRNTTNGAFQQILGNALGTTGAPPMQTTPSAASLEEVPSTRCDVRIDPPPSLQNMTDELLDMLDIYSSRLEDPDASLKSLEPILHEIKASAGKLLEQTEKTPDTDAELKEIATQSAMMANNEFLKFQRGDYL